MIIRTRSTDFLQMLRDSEEGSWEDFGGPEPDAEEWEGVQGQTKLDYSNPPTEHAFNILMRMPLEIRDEAEADTIARHAIDNALDIAQDQLSAAFLERRETMRLGGYVRWLRRLQAKIRAEFPAKARAR